MTELQYQIDSNGLVVEVKSIEGKPYKLTVEQAGDSLPWATKLQTDSRWAGLKKAISAQPVGEWVIYSGFASKEELKRAADIFSRAKDDKTIKRLIQGKSLETSADFTGLRFGVRLIELDEETP